MKTFQKGDRVRLSQTFWIPSYRGQVGTVYSTSLTTGHHPTCYVRLPDGRGAWELMADLEPVSSEPHTVGMDRPTDENDPSGRFRR